MDGVLHKLTDVVYMSYYKVWYLSVPKIESSSMQAVAIILQYIWFLSNQTDETRSLPEQ